MEPSDRHSSAVAPSLISGAARSASSAHEPTRILASLEGRARAASSLPRRRGRTVRLAAVTLMVVATVIAGLWAVEQARNRPYSETDLASVVPRSEPVATLARSSVPDVPAPPVETAPAAAIIVNLPPPESQAAPVSAPTQGPAIPSASSSRPGALLASAAPSSSARSNAGATPRKSGGANRAAAPAANVARKNGENPPIARPRDADVDLLAALLSHLTAQPPDPAAARKSASSGAGASSSVAQTMQEQIAQCSKLGFFEARSCRLRVCLGRIVKDSGCSAEDVQPAVSK